MIRDQIHPGKFFGWHAGDVTTPVFLGIDGEIRFVPSERKIQVLVGQKFLVVQVDLM